MGNSLLTGSLVRLAAVNPETDAETFARWSGDSEYWRLRMADPTRPRTARQIKDAIQAEGELPLGEASFAIRTLLDDRLIGTILLADIHWNHRDGWLGVGLGEREYWGKGYGADALRLLLRYAFAELNLWRVSLSVLAINERAIRSYEKAGFVLEGRVRGLAYFDGQRYDEVFMGILRGEWEAETG